MPTLSREHFHFGGATRNRTGDKGFADPCLTAWPWRHILLKTVRTLPKAYRRRVSVQAVLYSTTRVQSSRARESGADYGARTRHLDLGKVALYQMS